MKKLYIFCIAIAGLFFFSCGNDQAYDFATVNSSKSLDSIFTVMKKDGVEMDTTAYMKEITGKGMQYGGVPIKRAVLGESDLYLYTDTLDYSGKKLLEALETQKGFGKLDEGYSDTYAFEWSQETADTKLKLRMVNGKHLATLGDKDKGELEIVYKYVFDAPLANLHQNVKRFEKEPVYVLNIECFSCEYLVYLNGNKLLKGSEDNSIFLNHYIEGNTLSKVTIETLVNNNNTRKSNSIKASIADISTKSVPDGMERTSIETNTVNTFELQFNPELPLQVKGWSDGMDLRKDPDLQNKVSALYERLAKAILEKDETTINSMLYQYKLEGQQVLYDDSFQTSRKYWESYLELQNRAYTHHVENDFKIEFNSDGRLIHTLPQSKSYMLLLTGKRYSRSMNFMLYQPKGSTDLKIIR